MTIPCANSFAVKNVSTEEVHLQLPGIRSLMPGDMVDLLRYGFDTHTLVTNTPLMAQLNSGRLVQIQIPGRTNIDVGFVQTAVTPMSQIDTEQLIRGCDFQGNLGPFSNGGSGGSKLSVNIGTGSPATTFQVTHNFGTKDVTVTVYENASGDTVYPDVRRINDNQVRITFSESIATDEYRVVVIA